MIGRKRRLLEGWLPAAAAAAFIACLAPAGGIAMAADVAAERSPPASVPAPANDDDCLTLRVGGHRYCLPRAALENYRAGDGPQAVVTMNFMLPGQTPPTPEDRRRHFRGEASRGTGTLSIGLAPDPRRSLTYTWEDGVANRARYGLRPWGGPMPGPFGLLKVFEPIDPAVRGPYARHYVAERGGRRFLIWCGLGGVDGSPAPPGLAPQCHFTVPFRDVAARLWLPAGRLSAWTEFHDFALKLMAASLRE